MSGSNPRVQVEHLTKIYGGQEVVKEVSFTIDPGEFVSLVGPSGCGKSTVLEMIGGLTGPDGGSITVGGTPILGPRGQTGIIFQEASTLPWRTALDNVTLALEMRGVGKRERQEAGRRALATVGLSGFERHFPSQLSGGMRQRVALARALTVEPDVILADEPFGALDEQTRLVVALELLSVVRRTSAAVLFVTHSIQEAALLSHRVLIMGARPGQIIDQVHIDLPETRGPELIGSKKLSGYTDRIWQPLRSEAQRALALQGARS